jgi:hypothetical protein
VVLVAPSLALQTKTGSQTRLRQTEWTMLLFLVDLYLV